MMEGRNWPAGGVQSNGEQDVKSNQGQARSGGTMPTHATTSSCRLHSENKITRNGLVPL
jgi:hypothetical protein